MSLFRKGKNLGNGRNWDDPEREPEFSETDDYGEEYYEYDSDEELYYEADESEEYYEEAELEDDSYYEEELSEEEDSYYEDRIEEMELDDDDLRYVDDDEYDDDEEGFVHHFRKKGGVSGVIHAFRKLPLIDKVIAGTGVAVLIFAIITVTVYSSFKNAAEAVEAFASVGSSLEGIEIIGESGLLAVADAQLAKEAAIEELEGETTAVAEEKKGANVVMKMTSIVKDLKIKFVNADTDKLVPNVPFRVEVKKPDGKTETWTDDDKDGVIYKEEIAAGKYEVKMLPLSDEQYADYKIDTSEVKKADVKATIEYKKVDVADEIKTEAQVNAAQEDTAIAEIAVESKLEDTVPFLATKVEKGAVTYQAIDKSKVKNPETATASIDVLRFYLMDDVSPSDPNPDSDQNEPTEGETQTTPTTPAVQKPTVSLGITSGIELKVGDFSSIDATAEPADATLSYRSANEHIATVDGSGKVTGMNPGDTVIVVTATKEGLSGSAECPVSVKAKADSVSLNLDKTTASVAVNGTVTLKASLSTGAGFTDLSAQTTDGNVLEVSSTQTSDTITVKGKAAGTAKVLVQAAGASAECTVTVTAENSIIFNPAEVTLTLPDKKTAEVKVSTIPENAAITSAASKDKKIAVAEVNGKTIKVTAVAHGTTEITVVGNNNVTKSFKVTVINSKDPRYDTKTLLLDINGKQVYVKEANGTYRKAVYADYYKYNEFYLEVVDNLYTGWTQIDGKMYYYLANHKYVTGEQVIQGAKYTFASDGSLVAGSGTFGIDVSKWNGKINWNSVKASGVSYVIIRCGYRGSTTGALITDPRFAENISGATAAGLKVGVYFFTQAVNEKEAVEEASMVLSLISKYKISYPVFLDVESSGGRADGIDKGTRSAVCRAFCATIQNSGYTAGVYANKTWLNSKIDAGSLGAYKIWLAQYAAAPTYSGRYNLWQYSSKGSIPGISGNVDLNQSYLGY